MASPITDESTPAQHTPGPWRIGEGGGGCVVADLPIEGGPCGADAVEYYGGHLICESVAPCNRPLIAAAPELLAVLEELIRRGHHPMCDYASPPPAGTGQCQCGLWRAEAVVAKAKGQQP